MKEIIRIDSDFIHRHAIKWSAQSFFVFELDGSHPLMMSSVELVSDFYIFCHWVQGTALIVQGQRPLAAGQNSIFTFLPGQQYQFNAAPGAIVQGVLVAPQFLSRINFGMELSEALPFMLSGTPLHLAADEAEHMRQLLARLLRNNRLSSQSIYRGRLQKAGFLMYSYELGALYQKHAVCSQGLPHKRAEVLYNSFLSLLRDHFREERSVEFYAGKLAVTPNYFSEAIKSVDGRPAGHLIAEAVVSEIRRLLEETGLTVQEISSLLHFPDQATFTKYFKKHSGLSPKQYRISVSGKL